MTATTRPRITAVRRFTNAGFKWRAQVWTQTSIHGPYPHGMYFDVSGGEYHASPQAAISEAQTLL